MYRRLRQRQKNGRVYAIRHASGKRQSGRNCSKQAGPQPSSADAHISDNYGTEKEKLKRATTARCACARLYEKRRKETGKKKMFLDVVNDNTAPESVRNKKQPTGMHAH